MSIKQFFNSPQNRTGVSIWIGTAITALIQQFVVHQSLSSVDLLGLTLGFLKIIEPETTVTLPQLQKSLADVKAMIGAYSSEALAKVASDTSGIVKAMEN